MKKNSVKIRVSLALLSFGYLFPVQAEEALNTSALVNVDQEVAQHMFTQELLQTMLHDGKYFRATTNYYKNTDKAKIEVLNGKWQLTYNVTKLQTDTLQLDSITESDSFGFFGKDSTHGISCFYEPNIIGTPYSYECLHVVDAKNGDTQNSISQHYLFNLNGSTLTGKYHIGTAADFITSINSNKLIDLTGCNANVAGACNANQPTINDSFYNDATGEVSIPKVFISGKPYSAILQYEGNNVLRLKAINPL